MKFITRLFKKNNSQRTFIYCPHCKNELVSSNSIIRDVYVHDYNVVHYRCSECSFNSYWNLDHPAIFQVDDETAKLYKQKYKI